MFSVNLEKRKEVESINTNADLHFISDNIQLTISRMYCKVS